MIEIIELGIIEAILLLSLLFLLVLHEMLNGIEVARLVRLRRNVRWSMLPFALGFIVLIVVRLFFLNT